MTKKNILLGTIGLLSLGTLYAFTHPESVRETVFTLFFPEKTPSFAKAFDPEASGQSSKFEAPDSGTQLQTVLDTFPPLKDRYDDFLNTNDQNPIDLKDPKVIRQEVEYDPVSNMYIVTEKIGDDFFRAPTYMTFEEYVKWRDEKQQREYFDRLQGVATGDNRSRSGISDPIAKFDVKNSLIDRLFGGTNVDIKPQGNINLKFGFDYQKRQNPILTLRQQRYGNFDFDMDINVSAAGKIGEKLNLNFNYNTQATFDIDNQMKLNYDTKNFSEDEIIQGVEAGNVSLPLRSNLIKGAQNLFGFKTTMKFGHLNMTLLAAQQRSRQNSLSVQGGSQIQTFERPIDEYDENRHFFISHWNRAQFEPALMCLPVPQSLFTITRMEVWITNDRLVTQDVRDIVALQDLAEPLPFLNKDSADLRDISLPAPPAVSIKGEGLPTNQNNQLYPDILDALRTDSTLRFSDKVVSRLSKPVSANGFGLKQIRDFEKVRARLLSPSEYTYNDQLGFLSINLNVQPDQVVGVALEYTYNGTPYKIGEFTSEVPNGDSLNQNVLFVKMLKSTTANVRFPIWDLMMKNVYSIGSVNVDPQEFRFDIYYEDPGKGQKRFLNSDDIPPGVANKPLLQLFRLDTLNLQGDPGPDGIFDFVPGLTINLRNGRIMFPVLEPFGSYLSNKLSAAGASTDVVKKYAYPQLYDSTLFRAREYQQLNRFMLRGTYKSSTSSEISLGTFNLPQGSVRVTAGGRQLVEGADYIVDYNIGKVKILNDAILQSGQSVNVSFEDNTLFGFQSRTMLGARFDYTIGKDINIGATYMNLFERPLTQKV
ncbi:MAG: cell surface protein SprA, partial [Thermoanaerobaculia bacterium]|nr:cell surface protein SprA [Thermoanaerobaculia bacterium]